MTARAARSRSWAGTPGRTAAVPAWLAARTSAWMVRNVSSGPAPVGTRHPQRARDVRGVATQPSADVQQQRLAGRDDPVVRLVMWRGAPGTAGHDPEAGAVVALVDEPRPDLGRDVRLGATHQPSGRETRDHAIGGLCRGAQQRDLGGILGASQRTHHRARDVERGIRERGLQAQQEGRPERVRDHQPCARPGRHRLPHQVDRILGLQPRADAHATRSDARRLLRGGHLEPGRDDGRVTLRGHHQHRQPLQGLRLVARQPFQLRPDPDEQRPDARGLRGCLGGRDAPARSCWPGSRAASRPASGVACRPSVRATNQRVTRAGPSWKNLLYEKTRSAPASSASFRVSWSSCCAMATTGRPAAVAQSDRLHAVVPVAEQVDDGAHQSGWGLQVQRVGRVGLVERDRLERELDVAVGAHPDRGRAGLLDGREQTRGPDEVVRDDRDERTGESGVGSVGHGAMVPPPASARYDPRRQEACQVSPPNSSLRRSPSPWRATASSIWPWTSWSWVGRETRRKTPTGTGNLGAHMRDRM